MIITAALSAGITFLQSLLQQHQVTPAVTTNMIDAGALGAVIHAVRNSKFV